MAGFGDKNSWEVEGPAAAPAQAPKAIQPDPGFHERGPSRQAIAHEPGHNERGPSRQAIAHEKGPYVSPHNKPKPFSHRAGNHHPQRNGAHAKTGKRSNPAAQAQQQRTKLSPTAKQVAVAKKSDNILPTNSEEAGRRGRWGEFGFSLDAVKHGRDPIISPLLLPKDNSVGGNNDLLNRDLAEMKSINDGTSTPLSRAQLRLDHANNTSCVGIGDGMPNGNKLREVCEVSLKNERVTAQTQVNKLNPLLASTP